MPKSLSNFLRFFVKKPLLCLMGLLLVSVIYMIFLAYPIYQSIKISKKMIASTISYAQHPPFPDRYILVAGDSTAVGVGATNPHQSIAGRLGQQFPNADITNLGISGAKLKELLKVLKKQNRKHYDLIIIQIGANDITHFTSYETIRKEISEIIALCNNLSPKTILLTAGDVGRARVFRWPFSWIITSRTLYVRQIFIDEALKSPTVSYIDLFKNETEDPFEKDLKKYYAPDLFHLTDQGYGIWYQQIQKHL